MSRDHESRLVLELLGEEDAHHDLPTKGMLVVGCSDDRAGLLVEGQGVDDAHCAIGKLRTGGWAIKDLGSKHGTFVNGARITSERLSAGDVIVLGSRRLRVLDPDAPEPAPERGEPFPQPIPGYRIDRLLGRGGMGQVFLAVQESLHRPVALKILTPELAADHDFVRRFQSEARAAAKWNHPNVVVAHDVGEAGGHHFLSMEYMPGGNLEELVTAEGPLPWRRVLEVLHDAARGLTYAEAQGIVHRDLKPANLMLSDAGMVKIADLGLATPVAAQGSPEDDLAGKIYGTPHFISPEQARGDRVDHRTDLYSLGATAYRLLSGQTPFQGETTRDILLARFHEDPLPLRELLPDIPLEVDEVVLRLMAREPDDRFPSAEELLREVDRLRLQADHGDGVSRPKRSKLTLVAVPLLLVVGAGVAYRVLVLGGDAVEAEADGTDVARGDDPGVDPLDPTFFDPLERDTGTLDQDEDALRVLDLEAQIAYRDIPAELVPEERIAALQELIEAYPGTNTALSAQREIGRITEDARRSRVAEAQLDRQIVTALEGLTEAAAWPPPEGEAPRPFDVLARIAAYQPAAELTGNPRYQMEVARLVVDVVRVSVGSFQGELARADALAKSGDFEDVRLILRGLQQSLDAPVPPAGEPAEVAELRRVATEVDTRLAALDEEEARYRDELARSERLALATAFGPTSSFAEDLRALAWRALADRIDTLRAALQTDEHRSTAEGMAADVERARSAVVLLIDSFAAQSWRRQAVPDPRSRRANAAEIIGVSDAGVTLVTSGESELVPWSVFGENPEALLQLFKGRLTRDYTPAEAGAIAALLRLTAVAEAIEIGRASLDPEERGILRPGDVDAIAATFDPAEEWILEFGAGVLADEAQALEDDRQAALLLAEAIEAAQDLAYSRSVSAFERLFGEYGASSVVLFLSDGSGWREPKAEEPAETEEPGEAVPEEQAPSEGEADEEEPPASTSGDGTDEE